MLLDYIKNLSEESEDRIHASGDIIANCLYKKAAKAFSYRWLHVRACVHAYTRVCCVISFMVFRGSRFNSIFGSAAVQLRLSLQLSCCKMTEFVLSKLFRCFDEAVLS